MRLLRLIVVCALVAAGAGTLPARAAEGRSAETRGAVPTQPNFVVILTDDQRAETIDQCMPGTVCGPDDAATPSIDERDNFVMANLYKLLREPGVTFPEARLTNSLCCPSRASLLTGQYANKHRVYMNVPNTTQICLDLTRPDCRREGEGRQNQAINVFNPRDTIAVALNQAGYETAIIGKYMNWYVSPGDPAYPCASDGCPVRGCTSCPTYPNNEIQRVTLSSFDPGDAVQFRYAGADSPPVTAGTNDDAAGIEAALEGIATFPGDAQVSGPAGGPYVVVFAGAAAETDVALLEVVNGTGGATGTVEEAWAGRSSPFATTRTGVPVGWDEWHVRSSAPYETSYTDFRISHNGLIHHYCDPATVTPAPGEVCETVNILGDEQVYATNVFAEFARDFIDTDPGGTIARDPGDPFFLYVPFTAPHDPGTAETSTTGDSDYAGSLDALEDLTRANTPSFNEKDVSDKPAWLRKIGKPLKSCHLEHDGVCETPVLRERDGAQVLRRRALESLRSVDDAIGTLVAELEEEGELQDTMIVFLTDNGFLRGEHRLLGKNVPYEEATRTPFVVRFDALISGTAGTVSHAQVSNIDVAPTMADLAGAALPAADGESFAGLLDGSDPSFRRNLLVESVGFGGVPAHCGVVNRRYLYVWYEPLGKQKRMDPASLGNDNQELYNRDDRLTQIHNRVRTSHRTKDERQMNRARALARELCTPRPPGLPPIAA